MSIITAKQPSPFKIVKGLYFTVNFTWSANDNPVDLSSGYTAKMSIRSEVDDTTALLSITHSAGITLGSGANNIIAQLTDSQTDQLDAGQYVFGLQIISNDEESGLLIYGDAIVLENPAR